MLLFSPFSILASCVHVYLLFIIVKAFVVIFEIELVDGCRSVLNNLSLGNDQDDEDEYIEHVRRLSRNMTTRDANS